MTTDPYWTPNKALMWFTIALLCVAFYAYVVGNGELIQALSLIHI